MGGTSEMLVKIASVFRSLSPARKIAGGISLFIIGVGLWFFAFAEKKTDFQVLFGGLAHEEALEIVSRLNEKRIPYRIGGNGSTILVPGEQVQGARLELARDRLPRSDGSGFEEILPKRFGATDFARRLDYHRDLEVQLAKTISRFEQIADARVHLAIPVALPGDRDLGEGRSQDPAVSVIVRLRGRQTLSRTQVQSILNLVANSVPGLTSNNVTIVDTSGKLLFHHDDGEEMFSASRFEYQIALEENLRKKVESLLAEAVGAERVRARVTAEMDFSRSNFTEENFDPDGQIIRSEELFSEENPGDGFGYRSIPEGEKKAPSQSIGAETAGAGKPSLRKNITRNYEISRITRQVQEATGSIRKLSVAVMVDGTYEAAGMDESPVYRPRSVDEMKLFERIVKNAVGFDEGRGDRVEVVNVSFAAPQLPDVQSTPPLGWREVAEQSAKPLALFLLFIIFFLLLGRQGLQQIKAGRKSKLAAIQGANAGSAGAEEGANWPLQGVTERERICRLVQNDPSRAAELVRSWLREKP